MKYKSVKNFIIPIRPECTRVFDLPAVPSIEMVMLQVSYCHRYDHTIVGQLLFPLAHYRPMWGRTRPEQTLPMMDFWYCPVIQIKNKLNKMIQ